MSVQENGDIRLHGQEGLLVVFEFRTDSGLPRDMTGATVRFKTPSFSKLLTAGDEVHQMVLTLTPLEIPDSLLNKRTPYVILDETGAIPHAIIDAQLMISGWT